MVGLEGSLKTTEPMSGWVGRVPKDHRAMEWLGWVGLGWKGPYRSHSHGVVGLEGFLKTIEP